MIYNFQIAMYLSNMCGASRFPFRTTSMENVIQKFFTDTQSNKFCFLNRRLNYSSSSTFDCEVLECFKNQNKGYLVYVLI